MSQLHSDIAHAKCALGRELRSLDGFSGIGIGDDDIRLYVAGETTPVVKHFRSRYGESYGGYSVIVVPSSRFRATAVKRDT